MSEAVLAFLARELEVLGGLARGELPALGVLVSLASKWAGYGVVAGASVVKVPQILRIVRAGTAEGVSVVTCEVELVGYSVMAIYGLDRGLNFRAFGETVLLAAQCLGMVALVYAHSGAPAWRPALVLGALGAFAAAWAAGSVPGEAISGLVALNIPMMLSARAAQAWKNYRGKATGQLSLTTTAMNTLGTLARAFTSAVDGTGAAMLAANALSFTLNATLLAQILLYAAPAAPARGKQSRAKAKPSRAKAKSS